MIDDLVAESIDVHGVAAGVVQERFLALGGAGGVDAAVGHFPFHLVDGAATFGAFLGHAEGFARLPFLDDFKDVRDDFAGALDKHGVVDVQAEAVDLVHVVERGAGDGDSADLHWLQNGDGGERASATDLDDDVVDDRGFLACRIFVGNGPAWGFRSEAEFVLERGGIHFNDDAIDVGREVFRAWSPRLRSRR